MNTNLTTNSGSGSTLPKNNSTGKNKSKKTSVSTSKALRQENKLLKEQILNLEKRLYYEEQCKTSYNECVAEQKEHREYLKKYIGTLNSQIAQLQAKIGKTEELRSSKRDCARCSFNNSCPFNHKPTSVQQMLCKSMIKAFEPDLDNILIKGERFDFHPHIHFANLVNATN